jgi:S-adenosylmethionine synthetase
MRILTCEQVSDGHPDKLCDQIADAIVTDCLQNDPASRVAIECLMKDDQLVIAGELTSNHAPDYRKLVEEVFDRAAGEFSVDAPAGEQAVRTAAAQGQPEREFGAVVCG